MDLHRIVWLGEGELFQEVVEILISKFPPLSNKRESRILVPVVHLDEWVAQTLNSQRDLICGPISSRRLQDLSRQGFRACALLFYGKRFQGCPDQILEIISSGYRCLYLAPEPTFSFSLGN